MGTVLTQSDLQNKAKCTVTSKQNAILKMFSESKCTKKQSVQAVRANFQYSCYQWC